MRYLLEDKLRPPLPDDPWSRDVLSVALLLILASVLIPAWDIARVNFLHTVVGHMASFLLLPTIGFLLALRCGAIDLSVWVVAGIGGVVAAALISRGVFPPLAFAAAAGAGLGLGLVNAVLVAGIGLPSVAASLGVAVACIVVVGHLVTGRAVPISDLTFAGWLPWHSSPTLALRVLAVATFYVMTLAGLLAIHYAIWRGVRFPRRVGLFAAMCASAALSALGGACWLIDHSSAPVPTRVIDDLRVPAAAVLAGAIFLGRRGRELLAGMSLPAALLIVTIWRQKVWNLPAPGHGLALQLLVLTGMVIVVQLAFGRYVAARGSGQRLPTATVLLTVGGVTLVGAAALLDAVFGSPVLVELARAGGVALWMCGTALLLLTMKREDRLEAETA